MTPGLPAGARAIQDQSASGFGTWMDPTHFREQLGLSQGDPSRQQGFLCPSWSQLTAGTLLDTPTAPSWLQLPLQPAWGRAPSQLWMVSRRPHAAPAAVPPETLPASPPLPWDTVSWLPSAGPAPPALPAALRGSTGRIKTLGLGLPSPGHSSILCELAFPGPPA